MKGYMNNWFNTWLKFNGPIMLGAHYWFIKCLAIIDSVKKLSIIYNLNDYF